jgi:exodeoxyribonuclease VII large subunit
LPATPAVIGVITSPTGAVIRDILHRIRDRWPVHVIVWPVVVQGADAAAQVARAIRGFNAIDERSPLPRPDLLIVARGGGSVEDLWPFNDEALARVVSAGAIPLISAVGHETDTTLIDFVSDRRAPTPTAAAEMGTPVLMELKAQLLGYEQRMGRCTHHALEVRRTRLSAAARGLPKPQDMLGLAGQRFDLIAGRLGAALERNAAAHERDLVRISSRLSPGLLDRPLRLKAQRVSEFGVRLTAAVERRLAQLTDRLDRTDQLRRSLNPDGPLQRGFARVHRADGALVRSGASLTAGEAVKLVFADGDRQAVVGGGGVSGIKRPRSTAPVRTQGDLF